MSSEMPPVLEFSTEQDGAVEKQNCNGVEFCGDVEFEQANTTESAHFEGAMNTTSTHAHSTEEI